jgi:ParB family chromosome partitioning protein
VALAQAIVAKRLSVREAEKLVQREASGAEAKNRKIREAASDRDLKRLQEELSELLGAAVRIEARSKGAGCIRIDYASLDALDGILNRLRKA